MINATTMIITETIAISLILIVFEPNPTFFVLLIFLECISRDLYLRKYKCFLEHFSIYLESNFLLMRKINLYYLEILFWDLCRIKSI